MLANNSSIIHYMNDTTVKEVFDLILGRVFKKVYLRLNEQEQKEIKKTFSIGSDKDKENFIIKYVPDFKAVFEQEAEILKKELESI